MENTRPFHSFHICICLIPPSPFMGMWSWPTHSGTVDSKAVHICHWMIAVGMVALSRKAWSNYILLSISHTLGLGRAYQLVNNLFTCCGQAEMLCINPETHQRNPPPTHTHKHSFAQGDCHQTCETEHQSEKMVEHGTSKYITHPRIIKEWGSIYVSA